MSWAFGAALAAAWRKKCYQIAWMPRSPLRVRSIRSELPWGLVVLATLVAGCRQTERASARPPLTERVDRGQTHASPGVWRYHPSRAAALIARAPLGDGRILLAGKRGERWVVDTEGHAEPAARLAPETLVAISRQDGRWAFIGQSGTLYEAEEPLGPFTRVSAPLDDLVELSVAGSVLVGVRRDGRLSRRDASGPWSVVGPAAPRFVAVALDEAGRGLALSIPEQLFVTGDFGASWAELDGPSRGAIGLGTDRKAGVVVETARGLLSWQDGDTFRALGRPVEESVHRLGVAVRRGPSATALSEHRAFVVGRRYVELRPGDKPMSYELARGRIDRELSARPVSAFDGCGAVRLFGSRGAWVGVCARDENPSVVQPLTLLRSTDRGARFRPEPFRVEGALADVEVAIDKDGRTLVTGVCPTARDRKECAGAGVYRRAGVKDGGAAHLVKVRIPDLVGPAQGLSLGHRLALFIGRRSKDGRPALFVSNGDLTAFAARPLAEAGRTKRRASRDEPEPDVVTTAGVSEDGSIAFVIESDDHANLVVVDETGTVLAESEPPVEGAAIGAAGVRALAIAPGGGDAYESLDAGATWRSIGPPPVTVCKSGPQCEVALGCHSEGCIVGDHLSRIGWKGQADAMSAGDPRPLSRDLETAPTPSVKAPWVCALTEEPWVPLPARGGLPGADQAGFPGIDWFVLADEPADASVTLVVGRGGHRPHVERQAVLRPVGDAKDYAFAASLQVEGAAALRYRVPKESAKLRDVEVAWVDLIGKTRGRGRISDGGALRPGDTEAGRGAADRARPALLSIAAGGVYVRLHTVLGDNQPTYFLDGRRVETIPAAPWPAPLDSFGRSEMAKVDGHHVLLRLSDVTTSRRRAADDDVDLVTLGFRHPADFGITQHFDIAYVRGESALHVTVRDDPRDRSYGVAWPFRSDGAVVGPALAVPTQHDLGEQPRPCSDKQRADTPRVVVPYHPGTRHPVVVSDPMGPLRVLVTDRVVMHGSPSAPCAVAFGAEPVTAPSRRGGSETHAAVVSPDAGTSSWFFRAMKVDGEQSVDARPMRCQLDPSAEVPEEVYRAKGTAVR